MLALEHVAISRSYAVMFLVKNMTSSETSFWLGSRKRAHGYSRFRKAKDEFQINEINVDLRTSGFDNEVLSVDACAVWWERESFYCLPHIGVVTWHREPRFQCGSARTGSIWNSSLPSCFWSRISRQKQVSLLGKMCANAGIHTACMPRRPFSVNLYPVGAGRGRFEMRGDGIIMVEVYSSAASTR